MLILNWPIIEYVLGKTQVHILKFRGKGGQVYYVTKLKHIPELCQSFTRVIYI